MTQKKRFNFSYVFLIIVSDFNFHYVDLDIYSNKKNLQFSFVFDSKYKTDDI